MQSMKNMEIACTSLCMLLVFLATVTTADERVEYERSGSCNVRYRIAQNFGGRKLWRIWRFNANPPKFYPQKLSSLVSSNIEWALPLPTANIFSTNILAVPTPPKFYPAKVLCYTVYS